jgi:RNA polymerase sigma-70 factor (ECF subfamily)
MAGMIEQYRQRRLAARMARGETRAFEEFVDQYGARLRRLARSYARTEADADDLTQEILIEIARGITNFRGASSLSTWVYRVALNRCLRHRERRKPDHEPLDLLTQAGPDENGPVRCAERGELKDRVEAALTSLSEDQRQVVILHEMHGLTYAECAETLGIPIGTVKSRLSNAFRRLRVSLSGYVLGEDSGLAGAATETS